MREGGRGDEVISDVVITYQFISCFITMLMMLIDGYHYNFISLILISGDQT